MAVVVLGGLVTSTLLSLFVLPGALPALRAGRASRAAPEDELSQPLRRLEPEPAPNARRSQP